jgi:hypothetical protein
MKINRFAARSCIVVASFLYSGSVDAAVDAPDNGAIFDRPVDELRQSIASRFGCNLVDGDCYFQRTGLVTRIFADDAGRTKTIEITDIVANPQTVAKHQRNVSAISRLVEYLFPQWPAARQWTRIAVEEAWRRHADSKIKIGGVSLIGQFAMPDIPVSAVSIEIRRSSAR